jgi:hypothetical protein
MHVKVQNNVQIIISLVFLLFLAISRQQKAHHEGWAAMGSYACLRERISLVASPGRH